MISGRTKPASVEPNSPPDAKDPLELCTTWPVCEWKDRLRWVDRLQYACARLKEVSLGAITEVDCWGVVYAGPRLCLLEVYGRRYHRTDVIDSYRPEERVCAQLFLLAEELLCEYVHGYGDPDDGPNAVLDMERRLRAQAEVIQNNR